MTHGGEGQLDVEPAGDTRCWFWLAGGRASFLAAELWDFESRYALAARQVQVARPVRLQVAIRNLCLLHVLCGELSTAARLAEEDRLIAEAARSPPVAYHAIMLAAWRGDEGRWPPAIRPSRRGTPWLLR